MYWHGDPKLAKAYREADKLRLQRENQRLWLQGAYIYNIMVSVAPTYNSLKPHDPLPYMEHPIPITEKEVEEIEKQKMIEAAKAFEKYAENMKGGGNDGNDHR